MTEYKPLAPSFRQDINIGFDNTIADLDEQISIMRSQLYSSIGETAVLADTKQFDIDPQLARQEWRCDEKECLHKQKVRNKESNKT